MFTFDYEDDETLNVYLNGKLVIGANHDIDGWAGMERIRDTVERIAEILGEKVVENGDANI
jgi:hypothetical protein